VPVIGIDGSRTNAYEHAVIADYRFVDVLEFEDVR
jgi:hypothetical protein